jgi:hypothetical protein
MVAERKGQAFESLFKNKKVVHCTTFFYSIKSLIRKD